MAAHRVGQVPDNIGCVWTGQFDLNTLRVDGRESVNSHFF